MSNTALAGGRGSIEAPSPPSPTSGSACAPPFSQRESIVSLERDDLTEMLCWRKPRRIFLDAKDDLFEPGRPTPEIDALFGLMWANRLLGKSPEHTFYLLTRNPDRMRIYLSGDNTHAWAMAASERAKFKDREPLRDAVLRIARQPHPRLAIGVPVEDQQCALTRIPILLDTPAALRWVNVEPATGSLDLSQWIEPRLHCRACGSAYGLDAAIADETSPFGMNRCARCSTEHCMSVTWGDDAARGAPDEIPFEEWDCGYRLHWVRAGGGKGENAPPSHPDWMRSLRDQCARAQIPFHFSGWGSWRPICQGAPDWYASLYRSRRRARNPEDQSAIDHVWGKRCAVPQAALHRDGRHHFDLLEPGAWGSATGAVLAFQTLRKPEWLLLDGVRHQAYPD